MSSTLCLADIPSNEDSGITASIQLRAFQPGDAEAFRLLNEAWIRKFFGLEDHDNEMLGDPEGYVLAKGGHIFFAVADEKPIGCCALIAMSPDVYEVAKMAISETWQGRGIGRRLLAYTIQQARSLGAASLYLETNKKLSNAIHLYESLGFQHLPPKQSPYVRADVFMEMRF
ncbi:GNAT family N-acetyltransferase [Edaphobacter sp. HDX4]|uniref:GNAT family N-acetyltransferase n=1 Tax=Edaphobacter sp. HDX4 TaxID=2794064 RepID=UPI002FE6A390